MNSIGISTVAVIAVTMIAVAPTATAETSGGPSSTTIAAWNSYVAATEARINAELASDRGFLASDFSPEATSLRAAIGGGEVLLDKMSTLDASGTALRAPGGTIAHWRGAVMLRGITLAALLHQLQHPDERGPLPDDVLSLRVLNRAPDRLSLAIRMTRSKIVTATYDTEHLATYRRLSDTRAFSKSLSTKILEVIDAGTPSERRLPRGEGRGFLWRMNSYWRYEEVPGGVIVELESITLSRSIPMGLGLIVGPIVDSVARESMTKTLASVRRLYGAAGAARAANPQ